MKTPLDGKMSFAREINIKGQRRGVYFCRRGLLWSLALAICAQYIPPLVGFEPFTSAWILPAGFGALLVMFATTVLTIRLDGTRLALSQIGAALFVLGGFLGVFAVLGGEISSPSNWWGLVADRPDEARDLVIVAAVISAMAGWMANPTYPFRAAIIAAYLVFAATWMNFQGYYVVLTDGYDWLLKTSSWNTYRAENAIDSDGGAAFATMLFATLASWISIAGVLGLRKFRG